MVYLKKGLWILPLPMLLALAAAATTSPVLLAASIVSHFLILKFVPVFRGSENLWMFVMAALSQFPVNIRLILWFTEQDLLPTPFAIIGFMRNMLLFTVLFSIEEIIMALITRWLWKKQRNINF